METQSAADPALFSICSVLRESISTLESTEAARAIAEPDHFRQSHEGFARQILSILGPGTLCISGLDPRLPDSSEPRAQLLATVDDGETYAELADTQGCS